MKYTPFHKALGLAIGTLIVLCTWSCAHSDEATASRIQSKISQVGTRAVQLRESGADVSTIQSTMQKVDSLLKSGEVADAEKLLDSLLQNPGAPVPDLARSTAAPAAPAAAHDCDPNKPMVARSRMTIDSDCVVGGDLTVTGSAVLHFDYTGNGGRLVVRGNVIVQDDATLWIQGRANERAVLVIDNEFSQQRSMTSKDGAKIKLNHVEFRTQEAVNKGKGSIYMSYEARDRSSFEVTGSISKGEEAWLLANLHDAATLSVADTQFVPNEIYIHDSSTVRISGRGTKTGVWLDAAAATGTVTLPAMNGPFSWRIGAGAGLAAAWSLQVDDAQPGIGFEIRPGTALTIKGNGVRAPATGELKISYFVAGARETLDGLKAGLQNRKISERLTLSDVQLGPIAWQIYAGDNADLTIRNSTINEIGIFGRGAKVHVERSVLQLAVLAALGPGSLLDIRDSEIWNQTIEVANQAKVSITDSKIHGTLFHARDSGSDISIDGGTFFDNPSRCSQATMVNIATGQPQCNPFRAPGGPKSAGAGKVKCTGTAGCRF